MNSLELYEENVALEIHSIYSHSYGNQIPQSADEKGKVETSTCTIHMQVDGK